jgi:hypothetical protein
MNTGGSGNPIDLAKQRGGQIADKAQQTTGDVMEQARQQAKVRVSGQKDRVAETLNSVAHAVRDTGTQLRTQDQAGIAEYADKAADQIERFSGYFSENDVESMVHQAEAFARRQPLLFVGGTFLLGFFGARFLKSSAPPSQSDLGYGRQVPRSRVPARPGFPDTPSGAFGATAGQRPESYPARGVPTTPGTTGVVGSMPGTTAGTESGLSTRPEKPEDVDEAA